MSLALQRSIEREVVGQARAVRTLVRSVTVGRSGLAEREAPIGVFLFLGPSGTGKTHLARSLARVLHSDTQFLATVDCVQMEQQSDWQELVRQIAPHFRYPVPGCGEQVRAMAPLSILLIEHLEAVSPAFAQSLLAAFESGRVVLPDGAVGSLDGVLVLLTSRLCAKEIYGDDNRPGIGFSPASADQEEREKARIYDMCCEMVEHCWGTDFLGHLDELIIFHRLREEHLPPILGRFVEELNAQLAERRIRIELDPSALDFLLARSARFLDHGAWYLGKVFRRFVVFPVADLAGSHRLPEGSRVSVQYTDDLLRFAITGDADTVTEADPREQGPVDVPVVWDEAPGPHPIRVVPL